MNTDKAAKDCWVVGQLAGIRMLELEITEAFKKPNAHANVDLRRRVHELNSWLNLVDEALAACKEPSFAAEYLGEIIGHRPYPRNFRQITADEEPHVALGQVFFGHDLYEAPIIRCNEAWEKRDAVARSCCGSLRRLTGGSE